MRSSNIFILAGCIALLGLAVFAYKVMDLRFPLLPEEQSESWYVEARLNFRGDRSLRSEIGNAGDRPVRATVYLPRRQADMAMVDEQFVAGGYGIEQEELDNRNRVATFTKSRGGNSESIFYRGIFYRLDSAAESRKPKTEPVAVSPYKKKQRPNFVGPVEVDPLLSAIDGVISDAQSRAADRRSLIKALAREVRRGR